MTEICDRCGKPAIFVVIKEFEEHLCLKCFLEEQGRNSVKKCKPTRQTKLIEFEEVGSNGD